MEYTYVDFKEKQNMNMPECEYYFISMSGFCSSNSRYKEQIKSENNNPESRGAWLGLIDKVIT